MNQLGPEAESTNHGRWERFAVVGLGLSDSNAARRCHRDRSAKTVQISRAQDTADELDHGINPIFVWAQQQNAPVRSWRICPDVTESFIGWDQETPFGLYGSPHGSILCAAHSFPHNGLDAVACTSKKLCHL
jgi:hypothetical protein